MSVGKRKVRSPGNSGHQRFKRLTSSRTERRQPVPGNQAVSGDAGGCKKYPWLHFFTLQSFDENLRGFAPSLLGCRIPRQHFSASRMSLKRRPSNGKRLRSRSDTTWEPAPVPRPRRSESPVSVDVDSKALPGDRRLFAPQHIVPAVWLPRFLGPVQSGYGLRSPQYLVNA